MCESRECSRKVSKSTIQAKAAKSRVLSLLSVEKTSAELFEATNTSHSLLNTVRLHSALFDEFHGLTLNASIPPNIHICVRVFTLQFNFKLTVCQIKNCTHTTFVARQWNLPHVLPLIIYDKWSASWSKKRMRAQSRAPNKPKWRSLFAVSPISICVNMFSFTETNRNPLII